MDQAKKSDQSTQNRNLSNGASKKLINVTIARVNEPVFSGAVQQVSVPGIAGDMTILANHEALISPLRNGLVRVVTDDNEVLEYEIKQGTLEVANNTATILM